MDLAHPKAGFRLWKSGKDDSGGKIQRMSETDDK